ncbi:MAG: RNA-binding domain-containing protein [Nitrososphaera sp.]|jgi:RNA binding exosome subunit
MPEARFSAAEVNLVLHATEDQQKVLGAVENSLAVPASDFAGEPSEGHFGNKITLAKAMLSSGGANDLATRILSALNSSDRQQLVDRMEEYMDEKGNLYIRLDKQRICQGKVSLSETDAVRIKFKPVRRYNKPSGSMDTYRGLLSSIE